MRPPRATPHSPSRRCTRSTSWQRTSRICRNRFAKSGPDKFTDLEFRTGANGAAILPGTLGHVEFEIRHEFDAGDHTIYVGEATDISVRDTDPLLFFRGGYRAIAPKS